MVVVVVVGIQHQQQQHSCSPAVFVLVFLLACWTTEAWIPLPPWRGVRQLLSIGPWGAFLTCRWQPPLDEVLYLDIDPTSAAIKSRSIEERLISYKPYSLPPWNATTHCRVVAMSDTHDKHRAVPVPECDILIHCGDIMQRYGYIGDMGGGISILQDFAQWLAEQTSARHKIVVGGNHDLFLEHLGDSQVQSILSSQCQDGSIHYLHNQPVTIANMTVYGSPWSPMGTTGNRAFQSGADARYAAKKCIQATLSWKSIDILVTHAFCKEWKDQVVSAKGTKFWVHGHWHDGQGKPSVIQGPPNERNKSALNCISVNVAINNMIYRPVNAPIVYDLPIH